MTSQVPSSATGAMIPHLYPEFEDSKSLHSFENASRIPVRYQFTSSELHEQFTSYGFKIDEVDKQGTLSIQKIQEVCQREERSNLYMMGSAINFLLFGEGDLSRFQNGEKDLDLLWRLKAPPELQEKMGERKRLSGELEYRDAHLSKLEQEIASEVCPILEEGIEEVKKFLAGAGVNPGALDRFFSKPLNKLGYLNTVEGWLSISLGLIDLNLKIISDWSEIGGRFQIRDTQLFQFSTHTLIRNPQEETTPFTLGQEIPLYFRANPNPKACLYGVLEVVRGVSIGDESFFRQIRETLRNFGGDKRWETLFTQTLAHCAKREQKAIKEGIFWQAALILFSDGGRETPAQKELEALYDKGEYTLFGAKKGLKLPQIVEHLLYERKWLPPTEKDGSFVSYGKFIARSGSLILAFPHEEGEARVKGSLLVQGNLQIPPNCEKELYERLRGKVLTNPLIMYQLYEGRNTCRDLVVKAKVAMGIEDSDFPLMFREVVAQKQEALYSKILENNKLTQLSLQDFASGLSLFKNAQRYLEAYLTKIGEEKDFKLLGELDQALLNDSVYTRARTEKEVALAFKGSGEVDSLYLQSTRKWLLGLKEKNEISRAFLVPFLKKERGKEAFLTALALLHLSIPTDADLYQFLESFSDILEQIKERHALILLKLYLHQYNFEGLARVFKKNRQFRPSKEFVALLSKNLHEGCPHHSFFVFRYSLNTKVRLEREVDWSTKEALKSTIKRKDLYEVLLDLDQKWETLDPKIRNFGLSELVKLCRDEGLAHDLFCLYAKKYQAIGKPYRFHDLFLNRVVSKLGKGTPQSVFNYITSIPTEKFKARNQEVFHFLLKEASLRGAVPQIDALLTASFESAGPFSGEDRKVFANRLREHQDLNVFKKVVESAKAVKDEKDLELLLELYEKGVKGLSKTLEEATPNQFWKLAFKKWKGEILAEKIAQKLSMFRQQFVFFLTSEGHVKTKEMGERIGPYVEKSSRKKVFETLQKTLRLPEYLAVTSGLSNVSESELDKGADLPISLNEIRDPSVQLMIKSVGERVGKQTPFIYLLMVIDAWNGDEAAFNKRYESWLETKLPLSKVHKTLLEEFLLATARNPKEIRCFVLLYQIFVDKTGRALFDKEAHALMFLRNFSSKLDQVKIEEYTQEEICGEFVQSTINMQLKKRKDLLKGIFNLENRGRLLTPYLQPGTLQFQMVEKEFRHLSSFRPFKPVEIFLGKGDFSSHDVRGYITTLILILDFCPPDLFEPKHYDMSDFILYHKPSCNGFVDNILFYLSLFEQKCLDLGKDFDRDRFIALRMFLFQSIFFRRCFAHCGWTKSKSRPQVITDYHLIISRFIKHISTGPTLSDKDRFVFALTGLFHAIAATHSHFIFRVKPKETLPKKFQEFRQSYEEVLKVGGKEWGEVFQGFKEKENVLTLFKAFLTPCIGKENLEKTLPGALQSIRAIAPVLLDEYGDHWLIKGRLAFKNVMKMVFDTFEMFLCEALMYRIKRSPKFDPYPLFIDQLLSQVSSLEVSKVGKFKGHSLNILQEVQKQTQIEGMIPRGYQELQSLFQTLENCSNPYSYTLYKNMNSRIIHSFFDQGESSKKIETIMRQMQNWKRFDSIYMEKEWLLHPEKNWGHKTELEKLKESSVIKIAAAALFTLVLGLNFYYQLSREERHG